MSLLVPCSACGSREPGKNAWVLWAWNRADNERVAYRQRLCLMCVATTLAPLVISAQDSPMLCPSCHSDAGEQMDPIYSTYILPGDAKRQAEFATCGPCAVEVRNRAMVGADKLDDRPVGVGAPTPAASPTSGWDALGLRPLP